MISVNWTTRSPSSPLMMLVWPYIKRPGDLFSIFVLILLVVYRDGTSKIIRNPSEFPETQDMGHLVESVQEPMVLATIIFPEVGLFTVSKNYFPHNTHSILQ